jgi:prepilin peptidase CpaA
MLTATAIAIAALVAYCGLLLWAALSDFRAFIIPNQVSLGALALYPAYAASVPQVANWAGSLVIAAIFFAVGYGMWRLRTMGAGDAKLLPVAVLWAGSANVTPFLLSLVGASFALALIIGLRTAAARARRPEAAAGAAADAIHGAPFARAARALGELRYVPFMKLQVPYGVAIATAGIIIAINTAFTVAR